MDIRLGPAAETSHLACIWLVAIGGVLSAAFIMAASSWMQHPVGYKINPTTGNPELNNNIVCGLHLNPVFLWGHTHVLLASAVTGALVMLAVSAWHVRHSSSVAAIRLHGQDLADRAPSFHPAGHVRQQQARVSSKPSHQPMKITGCGRSPVEHLPAVLAFAVPDRRQE